MATNETRFFWELDEEHQGKDLAQLLRANPDVLKGLLDLGFVAMSDSVLSASGENGLALKLDFSFEANDRIQVAALASTPSGAHGPLPARSPR